MSWDPFQREVLAELGHVVYRQAGVLIADDAETVLADPPRIDVASGADVAFVDHAMLAHVARAAGMTSEALQARIDDIATIANLHGNAVAKRALWPRLRALRRRQR